MKIVCSKDNLVEGIITVQKAVSSKTTLPILEGVLIEAGETLKLTGNDLELGIECFLDADILSRGSIVINSKMFGDIIRKLPDADVLIEVKDGNIVIIECESSHFEVGGLPAHGFPSLPAIKKENSFSISQLILKEMIQKTIFAVSIDENRPILTGSLLELKEGVINMVCIDGFRIVYRKELISDTSNDFTAIVPGKTLNEISKILQPVDDLVSVHCSKNQIMFELGKCKVYSRLLEGEFMNFRNIIPKEHTLRVKVNTASFLSGLERASLITRDEKRYPVKLSINDDKIIITTNTQLGSAREEINTETVDGEALDIAFNPKYLIECIKSIDDDEVFIDFTSKVGPSTIKPLEGDNFNCMVLPVRA